MPSLPSTSGIQMSSLQWNAAARRVAGSISGHNQPDALSAARDAIQETLQDWDARHDWRFTQVVAPDIALASAAADFDLPSDFKKPYVAYLNTAKQTLWYIERGDWHRVYPGDTTRQIPMWYTLFNEASGGKGQIWPRAASADILTVLYYRNIDYVDSDDSPIDIPQRWEPYILAGARFRLILSKTASEKAAAWLKLYEDGIQLAKQDDRRHPDQLLAFLPPSALNTPAYWNMNSTWQSTWGGG